MDMQANIAQFLSVLGGSANPALLTQGANKGGDAAAQFRAMIAAQFSGNAANASQTNANGTASSFEGTNIWQVMNATAQDNLSPQNSLVLHLSQKGMTPDAIDTIMGAVSQSDLVTIIRDPKLMEQITGILQSGEGMDSALPQITQIIQSVATTSQDSTATITTDISEMNLEEFKEWKKANFTDIAGFLSAEKTRLGANGQIIKVLQGPAFLSEDGKPTESIVEIIDPTEGVNPLAFALQFANMPVAQTISTPTRSFNPLPFNALSGASPEMQAALQQAAADGQKGTLGAGAQMNSQIKTGVATGGVGATGTTPNNAASLGNMGTKTAANGTSMLTPFMTPAALNALDLGGDGTAMGDAALSFEAGFKTASQAANPVLTQSSASSAHPATQMIAVSLTRMASGKGADAEMQKYRIQLDPPEMGRIDIKLEFEAGHKVKAVIVADKPETLHLLQRDSHALLKALQDAGFDSVNDNSLEFNLSQGQNDPAGQGDQNPNNGQNGQNALLSPDGTNELSSEQTNMTLIIDPITGQQRVNMVV